MALKRRKPEKYKKLNVLKLALILLSVNLIVRNDFKQIKTELEMWVKKEQHLILHEVAKAVLSDIDLPGEVADKLNIDRETMSELVSMVHGYLEQSLYDFEEYRTAAVSTAHLKSGDLDALAKYTVSDDNMIITRDTGHFIKLYEDANYNMRVGLSDAYHNIIRYFWEQGFRMVEFDCDAPCLVDFPVFEH